MVNHMVQHDTLDRIYSALADSTRERRLDGLEAYFTLQRGTEE